jgi:hypothetical protein
MPANQPLHLIFMSKWHIPVPADIAHEVIAFYDVLDQSHQEPRVAVQKARN